MSLASILAFLKGIKDYYNPDADHEILQAHLRNLTLAVAAAGARKSPASSGLAIPPSRSPPRPMRRRAC